MIMPPSGTPFRQTTPGPRSLRIAGLVIAVAGMVLVVVTGAAALGLVGGVVLIAVGAVIGSLRIRITLDPDAVEIALVPLRRVRVPYSSIADCAVDDHLRPRVVGGLGVRCLPGGGTAILLDAGPAVRIECADGMRHLVRSTFPREAATRIRARAASEPVIAPADDATGTAAGNA